MYVVDAASTDNVHESLPPLSIRGRIRVISDPPLRGLQHLHVCAETQTASSRYPEEKAVSLIQQNGKSQPIPIEAFCGREVFRAVSR